MQNRGDGVSGPLVYFEELSFADPEDIELYITTARNSWVHIFVANLDTNYLTQELPGYARLVSLCPDETVHSRSFVKEELLQVNLDPTGNLTRKYFRLQNDLLIADLEFGPIIVPKGNPNVLYLPASEQTHLMCILNGINPDIYHKVLNPDDEDQNMRERMDNFLNAIES